MDQTCIVFSPENTSLCFWYVVHFNKGIFLKDDISSASTLALSGKVTRLRIPSEQAKNKGKGGRERKVEIHWFILGCKSFEYMHKPHCCYARPQFMNFRMIHTHTLCVWQREEDPFWIFYSPVHYDHRYILALLWSTPKWSLAIYLLPIYLPPNLPTIPVLPGAPHQKSPPIPGFQLHYKVPSGHLYYLFRDQRILFWGEHTMLE